MRARVPRLHVVLVEPSIAPNTGAIGRICLCFDARLHLIKPLGFQLDEKSVRRAGLDYWKHVDLQVHDNFEQFKVANKNIWSFERDRVKEESVYFFSKFGKQYLQEFDFTAKLRQQREQSIPDDVCLVFGSETHGLYESLGAAELEGREVLSIPLHQIPSRAQDASSLNLGVCVAICIWETWKQLQNMAS